MTACPKPAKRKIDASFSRRVLERDGVCLYGLYHKDPCGHGLEAHHLEKRSQGGDDDPDNGITLCHKHHMLAEQNVIKKPVLLELMTIYHGFRYDENGRRIT